MAVESNTYKIHPDVVFGENAEIGDFCVVGVPPGGRAEKTVFGAGAVLRSHTVIYGGNVIGDRFQTGHGALIRECCNIGDDVSAGSHSVIEHHVRIGSRVRIHSNAFIPEFTVLHDECWIGPNAVLTNARHPCSPGVKDRLRGPEIETGAIVGAGVVILPGVRIGAGALLGAGSVVVADIPAGWAAVGNPARLLRPKSEIPEYEIIAMSKNSQD